MIERTIGCPWRDVVRLLASQRVARRPGATSLSVCNEARGVVVTTDCDYQVITTDCDYQERYNHRAIRQRRY